MPARLVFDDRGRAHAPDYGDIYASRAGALAQAEQVFLAGNGLPQRWRGRARFVVLETGFGLGLNFLATWAAWRAQAPQQRCARLCMVSIDRHPPTRADLARALAVLRHTPLAELADALLAAWPPATPDLHLLRFDGGAVQLTLALGDIAQVLPELVLQADALYLDGFAPRVNAAMWDPGLLATHLPRLLAADASVATWCATGELRRLLTDIGFAVQRLPGFGGKRDMTVGRWQPRHQPPLPPGRRPEPACCPTTPAAETEAEPAQVLVIGAGLAGAAAAWALARQGLQVTVLERRDAPAQETSGNPAGLFHSVVHPQDGPHARWWRAGALQMARVLRPLLQDGTVAGSLAGLLRGEHALDLAAMRARLAQLGLPPQHLDAQPDALPAWGEQPPSPAWRHHDAGWASPADLVRHWLAQPDVRLRCGVRVHRLQPRADPGAAHGAALRWQALDADGRLLVEADAVVLAAAHDTLRLLTPPGMPGTPASPASPASPAPPAPPASPASPAMPATPAAAASTSPTTPPDWPLQRIRGMTTLLPADLPGLPPLPLPLADGGYALRLHDGRLLCGAVAQPGDEDPSQRPADHLQHLATLQRLSGWTGATAAQVLAAAQGRVGWRMSAEDRLPLIGPLPWADAPAAWRDALPASHTPAAAARRPPTQCRQLPRLPGIWLHTALGSRGLSQAALGAELLAAWMTGAPCPVPSALMDAVDVGRWRVRQARGR